MELLIVIGTVLYGLFMLVVPLIVISQLSNMRTELQTLNQHQSTMIEQLDLLVQRQAITGSASPPAPLGGVDARKVQPMEPEAGVAEVSLPADEATVLADLLSDPRVLEKAREVRRIYGARVCVGFLTDRAAELGMGKIEIAESSLAEALDGNRWPALPK